MLTYVCFSVLLGTSASVAALEPHFNVVTKNVTVISGQTAVLPCSVDFLGTYKVVWQDHREKVLTLDDRRIISDERISLERPYVKEWNLHVRNVRPDDAGPYTCHLNTIPEQVRTIHLYVHEPASIIGHLSSKQEIVAREGDTVVLVCNVTGLPHPTVMWFRNPAGLLQEGDNEKKPIGVEGEVLVIHNVSRYCDDVYECVAFNDVPPAANRLIRVHVEFPPEVRLPNRKLGQVKGKTTILECVVTAFPQALTIWRRHGKPITRNEQYSIEIYDEDDNTLTLSLRIRSLSEEDYGEYECASKNNLGTDSETMILYEYPKPETTTMATTTTRRQTVNWVITEVGEEDPESDKSKFYDGSSNNAEPKNYDDKDVPRTSTHLRGGDSTGLNGHNTRRPSSGGTDQLTGPGYNYDVDGSQEVIVEPNGAPCSSHWNISLLKALVLLTVVVVR